MQQAMCGSRTKSILRHGRLIEIPRGRGGGGGGGRGSNGRNFPGVWGVGASLFFQRV